jgi:hypothetical protein
VKEVGETVKKMRRIGPETHLYSGHLKGLSR